MPQSAITVPSALPAAVIRPESSKSSLQLDGVATPTDNITRVISESLSHHENDVSRTRMVVVIATVAGMTLVNSLLTGLLTVGLPAIALDVGLEENLLLWPASVYALTCGCTLLLSGSVADVVGSRFMYLCGCGLLTAFTLGCGLARNGIQLIIWRAFSGIAISLCLPSAVSIITGTFPTGQRRNLAFACLGAAQPVGFSFGLVLGGIFVDSVGWRYGYYIGAVANILILIGAVLGLPRHSGQIQPVTWQRLAYEVDWVGALLASTSLGLLSYVFAMVTASSSKLRSPTNIALLTLALLLLPIFVLWVSRQERLSRPAIIPNSLWRNTVFTCICITVFFTWAVFNAYQYFITLFFQKVQGLSAIQTSIRFLPMVFSGCVTNVGTGFLVQRISANVLVVVAVGVTSISSLLIALANTNWPYWYAAFPATLLSPIGADVLFTVSNLLITSVFPTRTHGLAGGVFNTLSQIGNSVGLAVTAIIASSVTKGEFGNKETPEALMKGYRATFWACFAASVAMLGVSGWGLRRIGKVGLKTE
ncbi:MAG: hypothetical protein M1835_001579 [Candelina submexicana]|nr:MAG: hypothetical protein M1835_001579 [Candelina submexicana]